MTEAVVQTPLETRIRALAGKKAAWIERMDAFSQAHGGYLNGSHYVHITLNLATGLDYDAGIAREQLLLSEVQNAESFVTSAETADKVLTQYFVLLEQHEAFRRAELTTSTGHFPDIRRIDRRGKDYHVFYVEKSQRRLQPTS